MDLSRLAPASGAVRKRKRVGRGPGSGQGKTAGKGHKGRRARSGGTSPPGYEGGQMPLARRLPKRGFRNPFRRDYAVVNLDQLERAFDSQAVVSPEGLSERGIVRPGRQVKVLAKGALTKALSVRAHAFSKTAQERIAAAGGSVEVIGRA